jgi:hypothetical protein
LDDWAGSFDCGSGKSSEKRKPNGSPALRMAAREKEIYFDVQSLAKGVIVG